MPKTWVIIVLMRLDFLSASAHHPVFALERAHDAWRQWTSLDAIAAGHADLLQDAFPQATALMLGGWSYGALIAMATARTLLEREPLREVKLLLIDPSPVDKLRQYASHTITEDMIESRIQAQQGFTSPELRRLGVFHLDALKTHQVQPLPLQGLVFHSSDHADALNHETWARLAPETTRIDLHETNHESILGEPAVQTISEHIQNLLLEEFVCEDGILGSGRNKIDVASLSSEEKYPKVFQ